MCLYSSVQYFMKQISNFGVDFEQYFYVSIDFVRKYWSTSTPKINIFYHEILHTAVKTNMN